MEYVVKLNKFFFLMNKVNFVFGLTISDINDCVIKVKSGSFNLNQTFMNFAYCTGPISSYIAASY